MKKVLSLLLLLHMVLIASEVQSGLSKSIRLGGGVYGSTEGVGLNSRIWLSEKVGFNISVGGSRSNNEEGGGINMQFAPLRFNSLFKGYIFGGYGLRRINLKDITPVVYDSKVGNVIVGLGSEVTIGSKKMHGLSIEAGYAYGKLEYEGRNSTTIGDANQSSSTRSYTVTPFEIRLLYNWYFL